MNGQASLDKVQATVLDKTIERHVKALDRSHLRVTALDKRQVIALDEGQVTALDKGM
jgi:hypothetical protein